MARIRTVKPELFRHEDLFDAEIESGLPLRLAFIGLFTICDREGRFKWNPKTIKLDVMPWDDVDFSRVLDALTTRGFIFKYEVDCKFYGVIPSFTRHQIINNKESASILPLFEEDIEIKEELTRKPRVSDATTTPLALTSGEKEGKGREKEKDRRVNHASTLSRPEDIPEDLWMDFLKYRKSKKADVTDRVIAGIRKEANKAGYTLEKAIDTLMLRGWSSFEADWVVNSKFNKPGSMQEKVAYDPHKGKPVI